MKKNWITCTWYTTESLQEKWVFFAKDNKILHPGNWELHIIFITETAVLYQINRDMHYYQTGRHSVEINFVYLTAGVSRVFVNFDGVTWQEVTIVKCHITKLWVGCPCFEGSRQNPTQGDTRLLPTRNWGILSKLSHLTTDNVKQIGLKLSHRRLSSPQNKYLTNKAADQCAPSNIGKC